MGQKCGVHCAGFRFQAHDASEDARATFALMEFMVKFFTVGQNKRYATGSIDEFFQKIS